MLPTCFGAGEEERVVVGRQATALVVPCDIAESSPLTSFLNFLHVSETAHPTDAGSTVTCLVHGQAAESQSVGCRLEQSCS